MGFHLEVRTMISTDPVADVAYYIHNREFNLVLFEAFQSFDEVGNSFVGKVFDWETPSLAVARHAILNTSNPSALLVSKSQNFNEKLEKILFVYSGKDFEKLALEIAFNIKPKIQLSVLTTVPLQNGADQNHIIMTISENMVEDIAKELKKGFDLIITGGDRLTLGPQVDVIRNNPTPVLIIYPESNSLSSSTSIELPLNLF